MKKSYLILSDGSSLEGMAPEWQEGFYPGEVVFTTGMTGYYESLTDPSFSGQILTFTYPLIGNYGIAGQERWESAKIHVRGVIVGESAENYSHHEALKSLEQWLKENGIPMLTGVDTRALTKKIRHTGQLLGAISDSKEIPLNFEDPNETNMVSLVSPKEKKLYGSGPKRIVLVDCGMKQNMWRILSSYPIEILRVPYDYDYSDEQFDGIFISNGPGDPAKLDTTIEILRKNLAREKPLFGVCLGNQLLAIAAGAKTYKLKFGHRGQNQPCMDVDSKKCYITSQNHGFAIDEKTLPPDWKVTFRNLNDQSVEGISHRTLPFSSVQFHPEACPGPTDTRFFFERFIACL